MSLFIAAPSGRAQELAAPDSSTPVEKAENPGPVLQGQAKLDDLYRRLAVAPDAGEAGRIEAEIRIEWSKSGSPAMDLLLQRGADALAVGETQAAIEHLTALIDHAPDFTEAYTARASAYYTAGEIGPALADLGQVLQNDPRNFDALVALGMLLEESEKPQKALEAYRAVQAIHPWLTDVNDAIDRLSKGLEGQEL
ncbi:tetratricopeptide repeat protein [Xinfangfangia sp. CPCC 101601]|uniref:Tetratricopeptide repeat protein n=1 Tax=Pseudogemmobacter lacusdianii TaxID=3069608 RepID=A0ABU0VTC1_9RHOB|nr:tetratricopeptide repeat protein [Xinfangfangia sp. CPCC 101601]MDQ2064981.1 tetratricopeptide repeat protein [Xinfangfangia sp. CPCC 101601]